LSEVSNPDPLLPQPLGNEDWKAWVGRFLSWLRSYLPRLATKDYVRQEIKKALGP
jgi:hypothetical protein